MNNKVKRIAAIIGLVLMASMFLITLIAAIFVTEAAPGLFMASVFCMIIIPIMIYIFIQLYNHRHQKDFLHEKDHREEQ